MDDKKNGKARKKELDDFWDIEYIVPSRSHPRPDKKKSTDTVEITVSSALESLADQIASSALDALAEKLTFKAEKLSSPRDGVIEKFISPDIADRSRSANTPELEYSPEDSLIHKVRIFKWRSSYNYYEDFYRDAVRLQDRSASRTERVPFFSYVPQYDQLSDRQLEFYLYFRDQSRQGNYIDADYSYVLLYIYEILNLGEAIDVRFGQSQLCGMWRAYRAKYPKLNKALIEWICDYSLINQLPPPEDISLMSVAEIATLKEFFVKRRGNDHESYARVLLALSTSYDYHTSKFAAGDNLAIFERYIPQALGECVRTWVEGDVFFKVGFNDSRLPRDAYSGALCCHLAKRKIEVEYCSFSKTNELRYLVGDIVKYSENKIRAHLGIKSRLSCYSLDNDTRALLDRFFEAQLIKEPKPRAKVKKQEYDVLYDIPKKPLSLTDAARIEEESWKTTERLVEAFEDTDEVAMSEDTSLFTAESYVEMTESTENDLSCLGELKEFAVAVYRGDSAAQRTIAQRSGKMPDSIVDTINEICADALGDILIEDDGGTYRIVEDYKFYFDGTEK